MLMTRNMSSPDKGCAAAEYRTALSKRPFEPVRWGAHGGARKLEIGMRRRDFLAGVGGVASWPLVAPAQQSAVPVIGYLGFGSPGGYASRLAAFRRGLGEMGYVE